MPKDVEHWSLTTLRGKLVKIGAKVVSHGRYVTFQIIWFQTAVEVELFERRCNLGTVTMKHKVTWEIWD